MDDGQEFIVTGDKEQLKPKEEEPEEKKEATNTNGTSSDMAIDVDDDIVEVSNGASGDRKRPMEEENGSSTSKKPRYKG